MSEAIAIECKLDRDRVVLSIPFPNLAGVKRSALVRAWSQVEGRLAMACLLAGDDADSFRAHRRDQLERLQAENDCRAAVLEKRLADSVRDVLTDFFECVAIEAAAKHQGF